MLLICCVVAVVLSKDERGVVGSFKFLLVYHIELNFIQNCLPII
jgi:hypothetical protein